MAAVVTALLVIGGFLLALLITRTLSVASGYWQILDHPNSRSLHSAPVPRTGGLAIVGVVLAGIGMALVVDATAMLYYLAGALIALTAIAWWDDVHGVAWVWRLMVQMTVVLAFLLGSGLEFALLEVGGVVVPGGMVLAVAVLSVVWIINLYNFMDGMDGLAAGMAVIGFGCLAVLGWLAGDLLFMRLAAITAAAALGFLAYNFPPARIFMGDTGSYSLGFMAAALAVWGVDEEIFPIWAPLIIFSPFIVDASVTLLARGCRRERLWQAHKSHYYQRLVETGLSHRRVVWWAYSLMGLAGASAVLGMLWSDLVLPVIAAVWVGLYTILLGVIARLERR